MKILADKNIYKLNEFLPEDIETATFDPNLGIPDVRNCDALFVRTVTRLNETTLPHLPASLKLIATASAGTDHIDAAYFESKGVKVINAKGCNARAVAEYVITALLIWSQTRSIPLNTLRYGIIGVGAVGSEVEKMLKRSGLSFLCYDPPRENSDPSFKSATLADILACDVLTFHVPLIEHGAHRTRHWLDEDKLAGNTYSLIINAARGGVVNEHALLKAFNAGQVQDFISDVWEHEPDFNPAAVKSAFLATPHIAGYSEQAKTRATQLIVSGTADFFGIRWESKPDTEAALHPENIASNISLIDLLGKLNPLQQYDTELRSIANLPEKAALFRKLREAKAYRFEYPNCKIDANLINRFGELTKIGLVPK